MNKFCKRKTLFGKFCINQGNKLDDEIYQMYLATLINHYDNYKDDQQKIKYVLSDFMKSQIATQQQRLFVQKYSSQKEIINNDNPEEKQKLSDLQIFNNQLLQNQQISNQEQKLDQNNLKIYNQHTEIDQKYIKSIQIKNFQDFFENFEQLLHAFKKEIKREQINELLEVIIKAGIQLDDYDLINVTEYLYDIREHQSQYIKLLIQETFVILQKELISRDSHLNINVTFLDLEIDIKAKYKKLMQKTLWFIQISDQMSANDIKKFLQFFANRFFWQNNVQLYKQIYHEFQQNQKYALGNINLYLYPPSGQDQGQFSLNREQDMQFSTILYSLINLYQNKEGYTYKILLFEYLLSQQKKYQNVQQDKIIRQKIGDAFMNRFQGKILLDCDIFYYFYLYRFAKQNLKIENDTLNEFLEKIDNFFNQKSKEEQEQIFQSNVDYYLSNKNNRQDEKFLDLNNFDLEKPSQQNLDLFCLIKRFGFFTKIQQQSELQQQFQKILQEKNIIFQIKRVEFPFIYDTVYQDKNQAERHVLYQDQFSTYINNYKILVIEQDIMMKYKKKMVKISYDDIETIKDFIKVPYI